jgi:hypothetical protein
MRKSRRLLTSSISGWEVSRLTPAELEYEHGGEEGVFAQHDSAAISGVPRRGRCVDDFVTLRRQRLERVSSTIGRKLATTDRSSALLQSALFWYRRKASKINDAKRSSLTLLARFAATSAARNCNAAKQSHQA